MALLPFGALLLIAGVAPALAGPLGVQLDSWTSDQCSSTCPETTKFQYAVGRTYEYTYASEAVTHIPGATEEKSTIRMNAKVKVSVISKCEMKLELEDVQLQDVDPENPSNVRQVLNTGFERVLQQRALRFAFQDGRLEHVCPHVDEPTWALNIKRAVLSGFQNTMTDLTTHTRNRDTDISGECDVDYGISGNKITKVKDLLSCSGRAHYDSLIQSTPFTAPSRIQSLPIIKGTHECEQQISSGILSRVACRESHVFRPFSTENSGATTDVTYSLTYSRQRTGQTSSGAVSQRESLVFEYEAEEEDESSQQNTMQNLRSLCQQTNSGIDTEAPTTFMDLVRSMRKLSAARLTAIHESLLKTPPCASAEQLFHAAIPSLGTAGGAHLIRTLIMSEKLNERDSDLWLTSMAFIARPSTELLRDVKVLLTQDVSHRKATLAVTSLVHNYCRVNANCERNQEVRDILTSLTAGLGYSCATTGGAHEKVLTALKGLGNAGVRDGSVDGILNRCVLSETNPMEVRVAAVNAFRRMPCNADRSVLLDVYESSRHDSELRINAYLAVMACPTETIIWRVRSKLENEEVNQVGSFVWTHLTNLKQTSNPLKQQIRKIVDDQKLRDVFDLDKRKFSRNIEWSGFSEMINAGGSVESNVIWSPKSFLPRSANLNLTVDMFGESVNLLELGGRAEGLDYLLESIFGPKSTSDRKPSANSVDSLHDKFKFEKEDKPKGSYFIRLFGNEIRFDDFHNFNVETITSKFNYLNWLLELSKEHNIDMTRAGLIFDTTMIVPTVAGFPLRLRADGTAVVKIKATGKFDIRKMWTSPRSMHVEGSLEPSAAIQINGAMNVVAYKTKTGLRMSNTLRTNTKADGKVELRDGAIFNVDVNVPDNRMEIFDAKSKFFIEYRDKPREQNMITTARVERRGCLGQSFSKVFGVDFCGQVAFPRVRGVTSAPYFPLTGPSSVSIVMTKAELGKGFHFETKFVKEEVPGSAGVKNVGKVSFNTPGSTIDREFTFEYEVNNPGKTVEIKLKTPFKTLEFDGALVSDDTTKRLTATAKVDSDTYGVKMQVVRVRTRFNTQFKPLFEVTIPRREPYRLQGRILYRENKKAELDLSLLNVLDDTLTIKGAVEKKGPLHTANIELDSPGFKGKVEGSLNRPNNKPSVGSVTFSYKKGRGRFDTISISHEWHLVRAKPKTDYMCKSSLTSTQWPHVNADKSFTLSFEPDSLTTSLDAGLTGSNKRVKFSTALSKNFKRAGKTADATVTLQVPVMDWDVKYEADFKQTEYEITGKATGKHKSKEGKVDFTLRRANTAAFNTLAELNMRWPGRRMLFRDTISEKRPGEYVHELILEPQPDMKLEVSSVYKKQPRHEFTADIMASGVKPIKIASHLNPDPANFQSGGTVQYGEDVYTAAADWRYSAGRNRYNSAGSISTSNPYWKFSIGSKTRWVNDDFSTEADVSLAISKKAPLKATFKADAVLKRSLPSFNAKAEWSPDKFVELTVSGKHDLKDWFHEERDLSGEMRLTTSFQKARKIEASFTHQRTGQQITTHTETSWGNAKKIVSDFKVLKRNGWEDAQITLETKTPFSKFSSGKIDVSYHLRGSTYESKVRLEKNDQYAQLEVTGSANMPRLNGMVKLTSSVPDYKEMSLTGEVSGSRQMVKCDILFVSWDGKRAGVQLTTSHEEEDDKVTNTGEITVIVPVSGYQTNVFSWSTEKTPKEIKTHAELQVGGDKTEFSFAGGMRKQKPTIIVFVETSFTSPYKYVRNLKASYQHEYNTNKWRGIKTEGLVQWATGKVITLNTQLDVGKIVITKTTRITTPFQGYETINVVTEYKSNKHGFTTHKEIKWGLNKRATLDTSFMKNGGEVSGEVRFTSSYDDWNRIYFKLDRKRQNDMWVVTSRFDYPQNQVAELKTSYRWDTIKKVIFDFKSPWPYMNRVSFNTQHRGPCDNFETEVEFDHEMMKSKATMTLAVNVMNLNNVDAKLDIKSPFQYMEFLKVSTGHKKRNSEYVTTGSIEYTDFKTTLENKLTANRWNRFEEDLKFDTLYKDSRVSIVTTLQVATTNVDGQFKVTTPVEGYELTSLTMKHSGPWNNFKNEGRLLVNGREFLASGELKYDPADIKVKGNLQMPYADYSPVNLEFSHTGQPRDMNQELIITVASNRINVLHEFKLEGKKLEQMFLITTPYSRLNSLKIQLDHDGYWRSFKNEGLLEYNGQKYEAESNYKVLAKGVKGGVTVKIPETYSISFTTKNNSNRNKKDLTANIVAVFDGNNVNANTKFSKEGDEIGLEQTIRTSYKYVRVMEASFNHRGPYKNFRNDFRLKWNKKIYTAESQFDFRKTSAGSVHVSGNATVSLPAVYGLAFSHNGPRFNFNNELIATVYGKQITARSGFNFDQENALQATARLQTPIEGYEVFDAVLSHDGDMKKFTSKGTLQLPFQKVKKLAFEVDHTGSPNAFNTRSKLGYNRKEALIEANHRRSQDEFTLSGSIDYSGQKYQADTSLQRRNRRSALIHTGSVKVLTPWKYMERFETTLEHTISGNSYNGQIESTFRDTKYFDVEYSFSNEHKKSFVFEIREPHVASVKANYEKMPGSIEADLDLVWDGSEPNSKVHVIVSGKENGGKYDVEVKVVRPERTAFVKTHWLKNSGTFNHGTTVQWGNTADSKADYVTAFSRQGRDYQLTVNAKTPYKDVDVLVKREVTGRKSKSTVHMQDLKVIYEFIGRKNNFEHSLVAKHPRFTKDVKLSIEGKTDYERPMFEGKLMAIVANNVVTFTGKLGEQSTAVRKAYIANMHLTNPATFVDFQFESEIGQTSEEMFANMEVNHKAAVDRRMRTAFLRSTYNKADKQLRINSETPFGSASLTGGRMVMYVPGTYRWKVDSTVGGQNVRAQLDVDTEKPSAIMEANYDTGKKLHVSAEYQSKSTLQFEVYRQTPSEKIIDSHISLRMNNSRLLHARAFMRPAILSDIKVALRQDKRLANLYNEVSSAMTEERTNRVEYIRVASRPIVDFKEHVVNDMKATRRLFMNAYKKAYRNDDFYTKTISNYVKGVSNRMTTNIKQYWEDYQPTMRRHQNYIRESMQTMGTAMSERTARWHQETKARFERFYTQAVDNSQVYKERFNNFMNAKWFSILDKKYNDAVEQFSSNVKDTIDRIRNHPRIKPIIAKITSLPSNEYFQPLRTFHAQMTSRMEDLRAKGYTMTANARKELADLFDTEDMRELQRFIQERMTQGRQVYEFYGLNDVENWMRTVKASRLDELKTKALKKIVDYIQPSKTRITSWSPELGDFQVEIYLPAPIRNLRDLPLDELSRLKSRLEVAVNRLLPDEDWILWDTLYAYRLPKNPRDWIPPFKAHATLAGYHHYLTFDGTFYDYEGDCTYLLAHDFADRNFSVMVDYSKKSIIMLTSGKKVEISSDNNGDNDKDFKVTVDGRKQEMPAQFEETTIVRRGNRVQVDNTKGVTVTCELPYDRCTVNVTGWYFAKMAGMLGTYDNEPSNDFTKSDRSRASSPETLADSWTVGRKCRVTNKIRQTDADTESRVYKTCAQYFKESSSAFRPCFRQVNSAPFMQMCLNDLASGLNKVDGEKTVCEVAAFYVDECKRAGVPLRQPTSCVSCKLENGRKFGESNDQKLENAEVPKSADVVFVVSQKACNARASQMIQKFVNTLELSFKRKSQSIRNNRYGLIGFGGTGVHAHAHSHTMDTQLLNNKPKFVEAVRRFSVAEEDTPAEDTFEALRMAAFYPFRAGVTKTIVLIPCDKCQTMAVSYPDVQQLLMKRDIKLHVLMQHDFRLRSNSPKASSIYGVTRDTVYTSKTKVDANPEGDAALRKYTLLPKDLCAALSHETSGAIFNSKKFLDGNIKSQKSFTTTMSDVVAKLGEPEECLLCECMVDESGVGNPVCHKCEEPQSFYGLFPNFGLYGMDDNTLDIPRGLPTVPERQPKQQKPQKKRRKFRRGSN